MTKISRNDPCPCGSGKKYKKCCLNNFSQGIIKLSEMIINVAGDFINLGQTIEEKQSNLNMACIAWNVSTISKQKQEKAIKLFLEDYKKFNPGIDYIDEVEKDFRILIDKKIRIYPNEKRIIVSAEYLDNNGDEKIRIGSYK